MMSFGFHWELFEGPWLRDAMQRTVDVLGQATSALRTYMTEYGRSDFLEQLAEDLRDCLWQVQHEVLSAGEAATALMPRASRLSGSRRGHRFMAWSLEQVLTNLDRLEVRGRDSAGISICCILSCDADSHTLPVPDSAPVYHRVGGFGKVVEKRTRLVFSADGAPVYTFCFKVANLVGRLGDNTAALRDAVREDELLWEISGLMEQLNIIAHTRWASNGIISLANCHPVDGTLEGVDNTPAAEDAVVQFVLNGDVDNYSTLMAEVVEKRGFRVDPSVTTDAKILPLLYRLETAHSEKPEDRFAQIMTRAEGSLAVVMQHPLLPRYLYLGQKGSGQSLFLGKVRDGFVLASEVYGLAAQTRWSYALSGTEKGGTQVTVQIPPRGDAIVEGRFLDDQTPFEVKTEPIYIHSRDIYRGDYTYYFEKEINEAPSSVQKTIKGKYLRIGKKIDFNLGGKGVFSGLMTRLRDPDRPPLRRIVCIGQGTASVAAQGVAYLLQKSLARSRIMVTACKATEMSGFLIDDSLEDALVIAISQSGTTTDTNRTVDLAGAKGAWIHSIVNRRNSPLVAKSDSYFYTSDGRDVEMAVASTKAFYSQITAGKLTALFLAQQLECATDEEICHEIEELERLPEAIQEVLEQHETIRLCAEKYAPTSRNWAVVGNGPNKIAANEIRIKLSELCYKSIPCDYTEDKKHIDLSTEPLTIVVANDLPERLVQDTAKEVSIFKAHNGRPLVFCVRGEQRFAQYAEWMFELPPISGGLGFVLATVAGHLWGFYAARAIDSRADIFRTTRGYLATLLEEPGLWNPSEIQSRFSKMLHLIAQGEVNAALPPSVVGAFGLYISRLNEVRDGAETEQMMREVIADGIGLLNRAIEEMTRPIDSIRHQAKTVTVGISRPQELLPPLWLAAMERLSVPPRRIKESDRRILRAVAPVISEIRGGMLYRVTSPQDAFRPPIQGETPWIQVVARFGTCEGRASRYDTPRPAGGSKRTAIRLERSVWTAGPTGRENLAIIPLFDESGHECPGILLFHLAFVPQVSVQQKLSILRGMGHRYHDVIERLEEVANGGSLEDFLERLSPRDLVLAPLETMGRT